MKSKIKMIAFVILTLKFIHVKTQVIITQDFESPLTGWISQGTVTAFQNSITPYAGGAMLALGTGSTLTSPTFSIPSGAKYLSFWLNSFNDAPFTYNFNVDLLQNGNSVLNLGSWMSDIYSKINPWNQIAINIPSGFNGNDYSIRFKVQSFTNPNLRFYLDEIIFSAGSVGILENKTLLGDFVITSDAFNKTLRLTSKNNFNNLEMKIFSIDGILKYDHRNNKLESANSLDLSLSDFTAGIYFVQVKKGQAFFSKRIIFY